MNESPFPIFNKILIDKTSEKSAVATRVRQIYPENIIVEVDEKNPETDFYNLLNKKGTMTATEYNESKKTLLLTTFKGQFFKRCPGASQKKALTCCNYHVLNLGSQCNMNCSYCYLQSYLNSRVTKIFTNIDSAIAELREMATEHTDQPFRVGTGEVVDSLSLDPITLYSRQLIEFFSEFPKWTLEFKTKSNCVDQFLDMPHAQNTIVSWSINAPYIIEKEEHGTARFHERLEAARKCRDKGFKIAFHLDPLIWHPEWKENYSFVVEQINQNFTPTEVVMLTLGSLRFQPEQRHLMRERFGLDSIVMQAEMFHSEGKKLRYDAGLRNEMFQFIMKKIKSLNEKWNFTLCMETPETWIQSYEKMPSQAEELKSFFKPLPEVRTYQNL